MSLEHEIDRLARRLQRRILERALRKHRRVAGRDQQHVALAQRHVELLGEPQHHLARGLRAPGFEEAQMLGGDLGLEREIELAQAAALAPFAQVIADRTDGFHGDEDSAGRTRQSPLPAS